MNPVLEIRDLTVSYRGVPAVHHIDLQVEFGCCVGLVGPNGAGKTTLLKAIAGLLPAETGTVSMNDGKALRRSIAYLPQGDRIDWDFPITVEKLVAMGRFPHLRWWQSFQQPDHDAVEEALVTLDLVDVRRRQIGMLSGGQRQRAFLARAWAQQARVYLLDEPFAALDRVAAKTLVDAMHKVRSQGCLVLASYHQVEHAEEVFDRIALLNGELVAYGSSAEVLRPEILHKAYSTHVFSGGRQ